MPEKKQVVVRHVDFTKLGDFVTKITPKGFVYFRGSHRRFSRDKATIMLAAMTILQEVYPMTIRQVYYQLFSQGWVKNSQTAYDQVVNALVDARQLGLIGWDKIEDRVRRPRSVAMWDDVDDFLNAVKNSYKRDVWKDQDRYIEVWLEKDALSGIVEDECRKLGVTVNVARGYDGWSSLYYAAKRFQHIEDQGKDVTILYLGDYDPSGLHMEVSLGERLAWFGSRPTIHRIGITYDDVKKFNLPEEPGKMTDSRHGWMENNFGHAIQVELDALPVTVLRQRIGDEIRSRLDESVMQETEDEEEEEIDFLNRVVDDRDLIDHGVLVDEVARCIPVIARLDKMMDDELMPLVKDDKLRSDLKTLQTNAKLALDWWREVGERGKGVS